MFKFRLLALNWSKHVRWREAMHTPAVRVFDDTGMYSLLPGKDAPKKILKLFTPKTFGMCLAQGHFSRVDCRQKRGLTPNPLAK